MSEFLGSSSSGCCTGVGCLESLSYVQCVSLLSSLKSLGYQSIDGVLYTLGGGEAERFEIFRIFRRHGIGIGEALQLGIRKSLSNSPRGATEILDDLLSRLVRSSAFLPSDLGAVGGELIVTFHPSRLSVDLYVNKKKVVTRSLFGEGDLNYVARRFAGYKGLVLRSTRY